MQVLAKNLKRFKIVTFDCTNTLFYFKNPPEVQYLKTAELFGLKKELFDKNLMKKNFRKQFKELNQTYPNFGRDSISYKRWWELLVLNVFANSSHEPIKKEIFMPIATKLFDQYKTKDCWEKFDKANELITALKDAGKIVGVISNFDPRLHDLINDMELPKLDFVITSYEAGVEKPNPLIFNEAIKASNVRINPFEALHIGNELEKDFDGARVAEWSSILINSEAKMQPNFKDIKDFYKAVTCHEIKI